METKQLVILVVIIFFICSFVSTILSNKKKLARLEKRVYMMLINKDNPSFEQKIKSLLEEKGTVEAVKYVRNETDLGLTYAKEIIEHFKSK